MFISSLVIFVCVCARACAWGHTPVKILGFGPSEIFSKAISSQCDSNHGHRKHFYSGEAIGGIKTVSCSMQVLGGLGACPPGNFSGF